jgi:hypothetical protein
MIEYGLLASKPSLILSDFANIILNFLDDMSFRLAVVCNYIPFWAVVGGVAAFALLIYWLFSWK